MINPSFKELSKISKSRYETCVLVSKRAREIVDGSEILADNPQAHQPVTIALEEIMQGKVWKRKEDEE